MVRFMWIATAILAALSFAAFIMLFGGLSGAPQEAALAASCAAIAVIPYVFTRALESLAAIKASKRPAP